MKKKQGKAQQKRNRSALKDLSAKKAGSVKGGTFTYSPTVANKLDSTIKLDSSLSYLN